MAATTSAGVRDVVRRRPVLAFAVLVLTLSWPMLMPPDGMPGWLVPALSLLSPAVCAFMITYVADGPSGVRQLAGRLLRWRVPGRWYLFVLFGMGGAVLVVAYALTAALFPTELTLPPAGVLVPLGLNFVLLFLAAGLGEEFGWRGFALPRLQSQSGPLRATLVLGLLWFAWHLPLYVGGVRPLEDLGLFLVLVMADAVVYTWVFNRTGGSVLLVALLHAAGNTWGGNLYAFTFDAEPLLFEYLRVGVYVGAAVAVVLLTRGRLGLPGRQGASG